MRPPDLPGGNGKAWVRRELGAQLCFNEAAGFTRRKLTGTAVAPGVAIGASMRPPDLPGGNAYRGTEYPAGHFQLQ